MGTGNPSYWEAKAGESLEPKRQRLQWAEITSLHSSIGDRESKKKNADVMPLLCKVLCSGQRRRNLYQPRPCCLISCASAHPCIWHTCHKLTMLWCFFVPLPFAHSNNSRIMSSNVLFFILKSHFPYSASFERQHSYFRGYYWVLHLILSAIGIW